MTKLTVALRNFANGPKIRGAILPLPPYTLMAGIVTTLPLTLRNLFTTEMCYRIFEVTWLLLGAFAHSRKTLVSHVTSVCPSIRLSACISLAPTGWISVK
jgi:hypothetical protein